MNLLLRTTTVLLALAAVTAAQRPPTLGSDPFRVVSSMKLRPAAGDGVSLLVVDGEGAALAGIDVVVLQSSTMRSDEARKIVNDPVLERFGTDFTLRMFAVATALGARYQTDADGRTTVAVDGSARAFVVHRRTVEAIVLTERAKDREVEVEIDSPPLVEVLVTDSRGRPAPAVPLVVADSDTRHVYGSFHMSSIETGRDGRTWVPLPEAGESKDLLVAIASRTLQRVRLDPAVPRIELQLPPCGQLRVYAEGEGLSAGRRVTGGSLSLRHAGYEWRGMQEIKAEEVGEDYVTFRWVGVDEQLEVELEVDGKQTGDPTEVTGPALPGEMKVVRVEGVAAPLERSVRLLGPDRQPLSAETILWVIARPGDVDLSTRRTDLVGGLSIRIDPRDLKDDVVLTLVHRDRDGRGGALRWTVPELRATEGPDLGEVVLEREPVVISGRVLRAAGAPVVGQTVRCTTDYQIPHDEGQSMSSSGIGERYAYHQAVTDELGRFELRELNPERGSVTLMLDTDADERIDGQTEFAAGTTGVELVLTGAARIEGGFAAFPSGTRFEGTVRLVGEDGEPVSLHRDRRRRSFDTSGLRPGTHTFEVLMHNRDEPVFRVEGVELVAGQTCSDPRLTSIDWTAFARLLRVRVVDPQGRALSSVSAMKQVRNGNGWSGRGMTRNKDGEFVIWSPLDEAATVVVHHGEYRTVALDDLSEDREVVMQPRPKLRLRVANVPDLPAWMSLRINFGSRGGDAGPGVFFDSQQALVPGTAQIVRPDLDGDARLSLDLDIDWEIHSKIRQAGVRVSARFPWDVKIEGGAEVQDLDLELSEDEAESLREIVATIEEIIDRDK